MGAAIRFLARRCCVFEQSADFPCLQEVFGAKKGNHYKGISAIG